MSVTKFSRCGTYLAAGGLDGTLIVWNVKDSTVIVEHAQFSELITEIAFGNNESDIFAADMKGRILKLKDFKVQPSSTTATSSITTASSKPQTASKNDSDMDDDDLLSPPSSPRNLEEEAKIADAFDDGMDDLFANDVDDDNEISISKIKANIGFIGDEYVGVKNAKVIIGGEGLGADKKSPISDDDDDDASMSSRGSRPRSKSSRPIIMAPPKIPFTEPQEPIQPASTPVHLDHRFMIWNNTGIIRNYSHDDDEKQAIDIEFHDAAVHPAIHLRNQDDYTLATLSKEVAVFANEKQSDSGR